MTTPDFMPILSCGAHSNPKDGACFMELASFLAGEKFSDRPQCADPMLAEVCRTINDRCSDEERQTIAHLIPRVIGTRQAGDMRKTYVRLACWAARRVLHLAENRDAALAAIEAAEGWCRGEVSIDEVRKARAAAYAAAAAYDAAYAAAYAAADAASYASYAADYAEFLTDLFDEFERLTGHEPAPVTEEQWVAACALTV